MDTPGVEILGAMHVFGEDDAPHGHMHLRFTDVRVPKSNILLGEGRGFEISQVRLGPGRIHHCMRSIGAAERALELMVRRGLNREAFGKPLARLGKNTEVIAKARIEIEAMRLMVLRAAKAMDTMGNAEARVWVSAVKAMVPGAGVRRSSTRRSRSTAPPASRSGRRSPACTPASARCGWPTAPTRCTGTSSGRFELARYSGDSAPGRRQERRASDSSSPGPDPEHPAARDHHGTSEKTTASCTSSPTRSRRRSTPSRSAPRRSATA